MDPRSPPPAGGAPSRVTTPRRDSSSNHVVALEVGKVAPRPHRVLESEIGEALVQCGVEAVVLRWTRRQPAGGHLVYVAAGDVPAECEHRQPELPAVPSGQPETLQDRVRD